METRVAVLAIIVRDMALSGKIGRLAGITAKTVYAPEDALQQGK